MHHNTIGKRRYLIFTLIMLMALVNYIDRGAISFAASNITSEYGFNNQQWGALLGFFGYGYLLGALLGGFMADRYGPRKVWIIAGGSWSILAMATAFAGDLGVALFGGSALLGFATIRIVFGLAEGPAYSTINKSISHWAVPQERARVVALGLVSSPLGALLTAPAAIGLLHLTGDWRTMFLVLGGASLLLLVVFLRYFSDHPSGSNHLDEQEKQFIEQQLAAAASAAAINDSADTPRWWSFFQSRTLICNAIGYFSFVYVTFLLLTWTPKYLQDQFHFNLSSLWYVAMIPWIGSCFTVLLGGRLSDWILKKTGNLVYARSYMSATCLLVSTICFYLVSLAESVWIAVALLALANAINSLTNSVFWAVILDSSPRSRVGAFSGITHAIANAASVIAPTLSGVLTYRYGYSSIFAAAAVATGIGMIAMLLVRPGLKPQHSRIAQENPAS